MGIGAGVGERDLGLDHPELGEVAAGVGVLGAEGRPEGVDPREREAVRLDVELPRDGEESLAAEEVLAVVDAPRLGAREVGEIERGDAKQRACALPLGRGAAAASASGAVMIGVLTQKKPCSWKKRWIAWAIVWRTRVTAPITLVRGLRCATSRRNSKLCAFGWIGYESGSSTHPTTRIAAACISKGWPLAGEGTMLPVASTAQPAVSRRTSSA